MIDDAASLSAGAIVSDSRTDANRLIDRRDVVVLPELEGSKERDGSGLGKS